MYQQTDNYDDNALAWFTTFKNAPAGSPLKVHGMSYVSDLVSAFKSDVTNNTLPTVSWIVGPTNYTEHAPASATNGGALTSQLIAALQSNPSVANSTVFLLNYDEGDGLYDHVEPPTPPPGTAGEYVNGLPVGLGSRVPMIIVSPWTRGGHVCSQVFDHTSIIRFIELLTHVMNPNITAWRRQVCGDLTSAFDFANPDFSIPTLPPIAFTSNGTTVTPPVPASQTFPVQEVGAKSARPLPYQGTTASSTSTGSGLFNITMANAGTASMHFSVHANNYRTDGPWQYDVNGNSSATGSFKRSDLGGGKYDLSCYGPNGFCEAALQGNINVDQNLIEVTPPSTRPAARFRLP